MPVALITGASRGLGRATARALAGRGWSLVVDARRGDDLADAHARAARTSSRFPATSPTPVTAPSSRRRSAGRAGSTCWSTTPAARARARCRRCATTPLDELRRVYETNVLAPLALIQLLADPLAAAGGTIVNVSSDAAVEAYPGWGGYGSSKAALDQLTAVLAAEEPALRCYAFDPGDMRTDMHQQAFPGEDISDRPEPESVVPALLRLIDERPPSGRYRPPS